MIHLRARVWRVTGNTTHMVGNRSKDGLDIETISAPKTIELVEGDGTYYLLRLNAEGICIADTWHESIEAAKKQAEFEYNVGEDEWMSA